MKYVLITPNAKADVAFFKGVKDDNSMSVVAEAQRAITTDLLSNAHIFEYNEEQMQYILNKMPCLAAFSAVPIQDIDVFKAKLAGV